MREQLRGFELRRSGCGDDKDRPRGDARHVTEHVMRQSASECGTAIVCGNYVRLEVV